MSAREANKELNRQKILAAAGELLRAGGLDALAMRALAERAKVSSRTPYNLFGSKTNVLLGLLDGPLRRFGEAPPPLPGNRVMSGVLAMVDSVYGLYAPEIDYYRTIYWGVMSSEHQAARSAGLTRAQRVAEMLVHGAIANRELPPESNPAILAAHVVAVIAGLLGLWAAGLLSGDELVVQVRRSLLLRFLGYCDPALQPELSAALAAIDQSLARENA